MSSKKTTTEESKGSTTQTLDPMYASLVYGNVDRARGIANAPYQTYGGERVAGFTPDQLTAQGILGDIARSSLGQDTLAGGIAAARGAAGFAPLSVSAAPVRVSGYDAATVRPTGPVGSSGYDAVGVAATPQAQAGLVDLSSLPKLSVGQVGDTDLSRYFDPYQSQVVDATAADLEHQRLVERNANAADATRAGAWRGAALAVTNAITDSNFNRTLAGQTAQLRSAGYAQALDAAGKDIDRRFAADQANQAGILGALTTNANNLQGVSLFNAGALADNARADAAARNAAAAFGAGAANTAALQTSQQDYGAALADAAARNTAAQFGAGAANAGALADQDAGLRAGIANQGAGQAAANSQLQAAGLLGELSAAQIDQAAQRAKLLGAAGDAQQQQAQAQLDWLYQNNYIGPRDYAVQMQQLMNQALGLVPATGTTNTQGSGTSVTKESPGLAGILSGIASLAGGFAKAGIGLPPI